MLFLIKLIHSTKSSKTAVRRNRIIRCPDFVELLWTSRLWEIQCHCQHCIVMQWLPLNLIKLNWSCPTDSFEYVLILNLDKKWIFSQFEVGPTLPLFTWYYKRHSKMLITYHNSFLVLLFLEFVKDFDFKTDSNESVGQVQFNLIKFNGNHCITIRCWQWHWSFESLEVRRSSTKSGHRMIRLGCPRRKFWFRTRHKIGLGSLIPKWCLKNLCDVMRVRESSSSVGKLAF